MRVLAPLIALAASLFWYVPFPHLAWYGGGTYDGGTYQSSYGNRSSALSPSQIAAIGQDVTGGGIIHPDLDFSGATVWYFSPDGDTLSAGTVDDPFPSLAYCAHWDSVTAGEGYTTDMAYIEKYNYEAGETWPGRVAAGDVIVLMKGDHGRVYLKDYYNTDYIAIRGLRGSYLEDLRFDGAWNWLVERNEWKGLRSAMPDSGLDAAGGYRNDYGSCPDFVRIYQDDGIAARSKSIIFNHCKWWPGESYLVWGETAWNRNATLAISAGLVDSLIVCNSEFYGVAGAISVNRGHFVAFDNNTIDGCNADFTGWIWNGNHNLRNVVVQDNLMYNQYCTNADHIDGMAQISASSTDSVAAWLTFRRNKFLFTTDLNRDPALFLNDDWAHHAGFAATAYGEAITNLTFENNIIAIQAWAGADVNMTCTDCVLANNTGVTIWSEGEMPGFESSGVPDSTGITFTFDDTNGPTFTTCVVANNFMGEQSFVTSGVTITDNYAANEDSSMAGLFDNYATNMNPRVYGLTPIDLSPLIDTANTTYAPATDFAGASRPIGDLSDIGAIESPYYKLWTLITIADHDSTDGNVALAIEGTTATTGTLEYQDKVTGGAYAAAGTSALASTSFGLSYETRYPTPLLPDSLYVRARLSYGGRTGAWVEADPYYAERAVYADTIANFAVAYYDSTGGLLDVFLTGTSPVDTATIQWQAKIVGGAYEAPQSQAIYDSSFAFTGNTGIAMTSLPDSITVRARAVTEYGDTGYAWYTFYATRAIPPDESAPTPSFAYTSWDSLGTPGIVRLLGGAEADEDAYYRFAWVDAPDTTFTSWTDTLVAAGDTLNVIVETDGDPDAEPTYTLLVRAKDATDNVSDWVAEMIEVILDLEAPHVPTGLLAEQRGDTVPPDVPTGLAAVQQEGS
jgi:hypothetical protein